MGLHLFPGDKVRVCLPPESSLGQETALDGTVLGLAGESFRIALPPELPPLAILLAPDSRFLLSKSTPYGILEYDATGHFLNDGHKLILNVELLGRRRKVQRRSACRVEIRSEVRYRGLAGPARGDTEWKTGELHDVSTGGLMLHLRGDRLKTGDQLMLEFNLNHSLFSLPAVVVHRSHAGGRNQGELYGLEYLDLSAREQDRMARAMVQLQLMVIGSRVGFA